jgi:aminoglycoside phosphotransferase (APT) family kinase protein
MSVAELPRENVAVNTELVGELIYDQFPEWVDLPLTPFSSQGTDNAVFRLGEEMVVRLPQTPKASLQVEKEQMWLPKLAPHLSIPIPTLLGVGKPTHQYSWSWSVYDWLEGDIATVERIGDRADQAARSLGKFITSLQAFPAEDGPLPGEHNFYRGVPLADRDGAVQLALASVRGIIDVRKASQARDNALQVPAWNGSPKWIHGDLADSNILWSNEDISAVIDFGGSCVGDPACDLMIGWDILADAREVFRETVEPDTDSWDRGRGWALSTGLITLSRFAESRPTIAKCAVHKITQSITDKAA